MVEGEESRRVSHRGTRRAERRLAAIMAIDVFGYSALMGKDEEETHLRVGADLARVGRSVERFSGRIFSFAGDGLLAEFPSASEAMQCARRVQAESARRNARLPAQYRISYRIGLNWGQIVVAQGRVGGTVVNVAARLERLARPGGIYVSKSIQEQLGAGQQSRLVQLGPHRLKNIAVPVTIFEFPPAATASEKLTFASEDRIEALEPIDQRPSVAVLPFRTMVGSGPDSYFAEGIVDDIIRVLGGLRHLVVVSRSSTLAYGAGAPDVGRIGRELDVRYILHGSVRRSGKVVRITVELEDAATRQTIWAETFDGELARIFELQDSIAVRTAGAIAPHVRERELHRSLRKSDHSISAYDLCLRALSRLYGRERSALTEAEALLRQAAAQDSSYATPHSHLAYLHILRLARGWAANDHEERVAGYEAARHASELDGSDALALAIYGQLHGYLRKDHEAALELLNEAVAISPSCALAWTFGSFTSGILGDTASALDRARRAVRLSPIGPEAGPWHEHGLSQAHYLAGEYDEAIEWAQIAAKHGGQSSNLRCLIAALVAAERLQDAQMVATRFLEANPRFHCGTFRAYTPLRGAVADLFVERLRQAGLPG